MFVRDNVSGLYVPDRRIVRHQQKSPLWQASTQQVMLAQRITVAPSGPTLIANVAANVTTDPVDTTGANLIVIAGAARGGGAGISDSEGNTWTLVDGGTGGIEFDFAFWYCYNPTTSATHTFDFTSSVNAGSSFTVMAFSGLASSPFDSYELSAITFFDTTVTSPTFTPAQNDELLISPMFYRDSGLSPTVNNGFTDGVFETSTMAEARIGYKVITDGAPTDVTWTGTTFNTARCLLAGFKF